MGRTVKRNGGKRSQKTRLARLEANRGKRLSYALRKRVIRNFRTIDNFLAEGQAFRIPDQTEPVELLFRPVPLLAPPSRKRTPRG